MDCDRVAREEILESYLLGRLSEEDRDAFEEHYFECARCFDELQTLQAIQGELRRAGDEFEAKHDASIFRWAPAAGLAAAVVLAVGVVLWMRPLLRRRVYPKRRRAPPPSQAQLPETPRPQAPEPTVAPEPSLEQLARVEPPPYEPLTLRGAPDEATARFQRGMEQYRKADYRGGGRRSSRRCGTGSRCGAHPLLSRNLPSDVGTGQCRDRSASGDDCARRLPLSRRSALVSGEGVSATERSPSPPKHS